MDMGCLRLGVLWCLASVECISCEFVAHSEEFH